MPTEDEIRTFWEDGAVHLRGVLHSRWVEEIQTAIDAIVADPDRPGRVWKTNSEQSEFYEESNASRRSESLRRVIGESSLSRVAGQLLESDRIACVFDQVFVKQAGKVVKGTDWHQDLPYMPFSGEQVCVFWIPVDHVSRENSLEFVRGSHADRQLYRFSTPGHGELDLPPVPDIENERHNFDIFSFDCAPGDVVVFHMRMLHGAATRRDVPTQRRTLSIRWAGDDVRYCTRDRISLIRPKPRLAEGEEIFGADFPVVWSSAGSGSS